MANRDADRKILRDAIDQNEAILRGLRSCNKVDNKSLNDLNKLFNTLNTKVATIEKNKAVPTSLSHSVQNLHYGPMANYPVGSWWGIRMDCAHSLVHCPFVDDVHDGLFGAASICVSYPSNSVDADHGDLLTFTGREVDEEATTPRESLILNYRYRIPLRLVRSYSLNNKFAPRTGVRYDGLYSVVTHWIGTGNDSKKRHKFALMRITHQDPPPWQTNKTIMPKLVEVAPPVTKVMTNESDRSGAKRKSTEEKEEVRRKMSRRCCEPVALLQCHTQPQNNFRLKLAADVPQQEPPSPVSIRRDLYTWARNDNEMKKKKDARIEEQHQTKNGLIQQIKQEDNRPKVTKPDNSSEIISPEKLLNSILEKRNHPMAQLLIQNMIGVQETNVIKAYESLNKSVVAPPKQTQVKKVTKNQRILRSHVEGSSLDTRKLRDRKIKVLNSENKNKERRKRHSSECSKVVTLAKETSVRREVDIKSTVDVGTQCNLIPRASSDRASQTECQGVKSESEEESAESGEEEEESDDANSEEEVSGSYYEYAPPASAFAPVLKIGNGLRIERLRSIGFRPICQSAVNKNVDEDYNRYVAEENDKVGYMDEELHFEDIENEDTRLSKFAQLRKRHCVQSTSKAELFGQDIRWGRKLVWPGWA